jgi:GNAT superfamily N-acetyltransferase
MTPPSIQVAESDPAILACYPLIAELRPHLTDPVAFLEQVRRQQAQGYRLVWIESQGIMRALAGWRLSEHLAWGRILYVDDLVTRAEDQGRGWASQLFDWLVAEAARAGCANLHLDSGVQRFPAHRFYLHKGMNLTCHHFEMRIQPSPAPQALHPLAPADGCPPPAAESTHQNEDC